MAAITLLAACSSGDGSDGSSSTTKARPTTSSVASTVAPTTSTASTSAAPATSAAPSTTRPTGCTTGGGEPPAGAITKEVADVDGDGRPDTAWLEQGEDGTTTFGIRTAAGGGAVAPFPSASPVRRSVLVVDADGRAPTELLFDDGRSVGLSVFDDCQIQDVQNPEGERYTFGLGFDDVGTGIGCIDTPDGRRLVGLDRGTDPDETVVPWTSTEVVLDGTKARNGRTRSGTYHLPADQAKADLLGDVTCGDLTVDHDAVTSSD